MNLLLSQLGNSAGIQRLSHFRKIRPSYREKLMTTGRWKGAKIVKSAITCTDNGSSLIRGYGSVINYYYYFSTISVLVFNQNDSICRLFARWTNLESRIIRHDDSTMDHHRRVIRGPFGPRPGWLTGLFAPVTREPSLWSAPPLEEKNRGIVLGREKGSRY